MMVICRDRFGRPACPAISLSGRACTQPECSLHPHRLCGTHFAAWVRKSQVRLRDGTVLNPTSPPSEWAEKLRVKLERQKEATRAQQRGQKALGRAAIGSDEKRKDDLFRSMLREKPIVPDHIREFSEALSRYQGDGRRIRDELRLSEGAYIELVRLTREEYGL